MVRNTEARDHVSKIYQKMAAILAEFPAVTKDHKNPSQGYQYRGIDDGLAALKPLLAKHGVFMQLVDLVPTFSEAGTTRSGAAQVRCVVTGKVRFVCGEDASFTECTLIGEGIDLSDKAMMKAQANGLKYAIWYTFCVPTAEKKDSEAFEDPDSTPPAGKRAKKHDGGGGKTNGSGENLEQALRDSIALVRGEAVQDASALLQKIDAVKTKDQLLAIRQDVRDWCKANAEHLQRKAVVDAFIEKQQAVGA